MQLKKSDEIIKVQEVFKSFEDDVEKLRAQEIEARDNFLSLEVQVKQAEKQLWLAKGRSVQAREDFILLKAIIQQSNVAWDQEVEDMEAFRHRSMSSIKEKSFISGYRNAYEEIKAVPKGQKKKPRPVAEAVLVKRAKKEMGEE